MTKLDNDDIFSQFEEIEEKVDFLIELCKSLETTNSELQKKVESLESEIQSKTEAEYRNKEQKTMIRSRIDGILAKLSNFSELS